MARREALPPCLDYVAWETQPALTARSQTAPEPEPTPPTHQQRKRLAVVWGVSETTRHLVRGLLRARGGWSFTRDPRHPDVALQWASPPDIHWDSVLDGRSVANHAPARSGLVRKAELARNLQRAGLGPSPLPVSHTSFDILGEEAGGTEARAARAEAFLAQLLAADAAADERRGWVLKASESSNGAAVRCFSAADGVPLDALRELLAAGRPWLVQRYVERPLLVRGCKTHCRGYVLVLGAPGPARSVFVHKDLVPVFVSAEPFSLDDIGSNRFAHLTNRSIQTTHPDYDDDKQRCELY